MFFKLVQNLAYSFNMKLARVFNIYQNIIQIYNNTNIELFQKNLINISFKYG